MPPAELLLPLFPLNVVLFPRAPLPLHVFEERYKEMVDAVLANDGLFGVICAGSSSVASVGCTAKVVKVIKRYDDGRLDILTVGDRRFRVRRLRRDKPYLQGWVSFFSDTTTGRLPQLRSRCLQLFQELYGATPGNIALSELEEASPEVVSYYLAYFSDLPLGTKQQLLELKRTDERLRQECDALEQLGRDRARRSVVHSNGHLPR